MTKGINSDVFLAAEIPADLAVLNISPFGELLLIIFLKIFLKIYFKFSSSCSIVNFFDISTIETLFFFRCENFIFLLFFVFPHKYY